MLRKETVEVCCCGKARRGLGNTKASPITAHLRVWSNSYNRNGATPWTNKCGAISIPSRLFDEPSPSLAVLHLLRQTRATRHAGAVSTREAPCLEYVHPPLCACHVLSQILCTHQCQIQDCRSRSATCGLTGQTVA